MAGGKDEATPARGEAAGGLQIGLARHGDHVPAYAGGDLVKLEVLVRNVSDKPVEYNHHDSDAFYTPPTARVADGKDVKVLAPTVQFPGAWAIHRFTPAPGEQRHLSTLTPAFDPVAPDKDDSRLIFVARAAAGRYEVTYPASRPSSAKEEPAGRWVSGAA